MSVQEAPPVRRKKKHAHPHHGGSWKVAYADFVTAMMALFMVMWLLSQTDVTMKKKIAEYFRTGLFQGAPSILVGGSGIAEKGFLDLDTSSVLKVDQTKMEDSAFLISQRVEELAAATPGFESLSKHVQVSVTDYGLLIQIFDGGDEFLFDRSSAELKPGLVALLEQLAPILTTLDNPLQLHGHTDARPFPEGSDRTNWSLSFDRADRARAVLEGAGLREGQVSGVFAHGAMAPLVPDPNAPENRRLSILAVRRGLENKPPDPGTPDIL